MLSPSEGAGCLRVTHPFATKITEVISVRLACVRHAASVRPEPGSNSPIKFIEEPIWLLVIKKEIYLTWSCVYTLDPHIRFFIGYCSVFKVHCLAIRAFVLLPYRVDLYIIPSLPIMSTPFCHFFNIFS